jgi:polyamine oxidase
VRLNTEVVSIDYGKEIIEVSTKNGVFYGRKVLCSLPLGILKNGSVQFQPPLPESKIKAIENMGVGVFNKVQVCFSAPFWDTSKQYLLLVVDDEPFFRIRAFYDGGRYILCAYVSGEASRQLSSLTDTQIV